MKLDWCGIRNADGNFASGILEIKTEAECRANAERKRNDYRFTMSGSSGRMYRALTILKKKRRDESGENGENQY